MTQAAPLEQICLYALADWCPPGDLNDDCAVDMDDLAVFADQWLGAEDLPADLTGGGVNTEDFAVLANHWLDARPKVVINEIHYNPDLKQELVEFIELHNASPFAADLSGWRFCDGVAFTFPSGTTIPANGYLVVAEDPTPAVTDVTISGKYGTPVAVVHVPFIGGLSNDGETVKLCDGSGQTVDKVDYGLGFPWPTVGDAVPDVLPGGTGHSIQLVNPFFDNDLGGSWRSAYPTPGSANTAVYAENIPPHIRQVEHSPMQPAAGQAVTVTAKVTDPDGVASVTLSLQFVNPGAYIRKTDAAYANVSQTITMRDDGTGGDLEAGDAVYTAIVDAAVQQHRRLVRYRITAADAGGRSLTVPYADDPQKHFAYFVYNGVPSWKGANQPGVTPVVTFSQEVMQSLPAYHLIASEIDVVYSQYLESYQETRLWGTLVYDGIVYDNVQYQVRGEVSTYVSGKNKWKFFFGRGHDFQARDNYGQKYPVPWKTMNLAACATPWVPANRGMAGVDETLAFTLYRLAGVPSPNNNFFQLRVIDRPEEAHATNQYEGDLWGLYMTIENPDSRFLDTRNLPDGNLYKLEGVGDKKHQGPTQSVDASDLNAFTAAYQQGQPVDWWKAHVDLDNYFSFRSIDRAVNNMDLREGWNIYYYHRPVTAGDPLSDRWTVIPWDLDMLYCAASHWPGVIDIQNCLQHSEFSIAYKNRGRELQDLLLNDDQLGQLVNELAAMVNPAGWTWTMTDVDQFMWNYHNRASTTNPVHRGAFYQNPGYQGGKGTPTYSRMLVTANHEGMMQWLKDFLTPPPSGGSTHTSSWPYGNGWGFLDSEVADSAIPGTPVITYQGSAGYPVNDLKFQTSAFSDPQGSGTFGAVRWRIAEVEPFSVSTTPGSVQTLVPSGTAWNYFIGSAEPAADWKLKTFTGTWPSGNAPLGYGVSSPAIATSLQSMKNRYTTVYFRTAFDINDPSAVASLSLTTTYEEGFNVWINGTFVDSLNSPGSGALYTATASGSVGSPQTVTRTWSNPSAYLTAGTNVIAVQLLNYTAGSSDIFWQASLSASFSGQSGNPPAVQLVKPGKYEITALWDSGEITTAGQLTAQIPASVVKTGKTYRVRSRMKDNTGRWSRWSAPIQFTTGLPLSGGIIDNLRVTELMYNPAAANTAKGELNVAADEFEYLELKNTGDITLDLTNVSIVNGVTFSFSSAPAEKRSLTAGQFILVVRNPSAFLSRYPGLADRTVGPYTGKFDNTGEKVELSDYYNGTVADFEYNDGMGWPLAADGGGHSLVPLDAALPGQPEGSLRWGGNWRACSFRNGSPAADDPAAPAGVVINEVMAHTDYSDPLRPEYDSNDWIELYNPTGLSIELNSDWYLSDDPGNLKKWALPAAAIWPHGWISVDEVTGFHNPITSGFGLDKTGEYVLLSHLPGTSADRVVDGIKFGGQYNSVSTGRYPDGGAWWFMLPGTRGTANAAPVPPKVVISEILYHPTDGTANEEYVELYNPAGAAVNLYNSVGTWRLENAVTYAFPAAKSIPAGGRIVVVPFDPAVETTRLAAFNAAWGSSLAAGVTIFGPWTGTLSDGGERIALQEPQEADPPQTPVPWWITIDQVIYGDYTPWPTDADGNGLSLHRVSSGADKSGDDPANWTSGAGSPGN